MNRHPLIWLKYSTHKTGNRVDIAFAAGRQVADNIYPSAVKKHETLKKGFGKTGLTGSWELISILRIFSKSEIVFFPRLMGCVSLWRFSSGHDFVDLGGKIRNIERFLKKKNIRGYDAVMNNGIIRIP